MKRWLWLALQLVSVALFGLLLWRGGSDSWRLVLTGDRWAVLAAFLFTGLAQMLSAWRLQGMAEGVAKRPLAPWRAFYQVTMTAQLLGLLLPRGASAIGGKSVGLRALGVGLQRAVWVVLLDNLFDILVLGLISLPALLFLLGRLGVGAFLMLSALLMLLLAGALAWATTGDRLLRPVVWLRQLPRFGDRLHERAAPLARVIPGQRPLLRTQLLTVTLSIALTLRFYFVGQAIGLDAGWLLFLAIFPMTQLSLAVAIAPGGLGLFDLGWAGLLHLAGASESSALAFAIAQRTYITLFIFVWAGFSSLLSLTVRGRPAPAATNGVDGGQEAELSAKTIQP